MPPMATVLCWHLMFGSSQLQGGSEDLLTRFAVLKDSLCLHVPCDNSEYVFINQYLKQLAEVQISDSAGIYPV